MRLLLLVTLIAVSTTDAIAQDTKADEAAIRALISRRNETGTELPALPGRVYWTGAYERPVMGDEKPVERAGPGGPSDRVAGSFRETITIKKIEVSKAGDMAWEYSASRVTYETKSSRQKADFTSSTLGVWRKENGQWKIAAQFTRPNE